MAEQPPPGNYYPPPSGYPPPGGYPSPQGGYPPPPPSSYQPPPPPEPAITWPMEAYTTWARRVAAALIDGIPVLVAMGIGFGMIMGTQETACQAQMSEYDIAEFCSTGSSVLGLVSFWIALLLSVAYGIWNYGYRQGTSGSSIGKAIMKSIVVSEKTGEPIGFALSVVRQIAHILDAAICWIGFLFPLWDSKRQTFADKLMSTVCLNHHG
jgi:uncharacterized RDD family membrane protein YckC